MHPRQASLVADTQAVASSLHALWVDPLTFEPAANGAPYLPEKPVVKTAASEGGSVLAIMLSRMPETRAAELGVLVGVLRAGALVHQSHHWQTRGPAYYADHLLFERLYDTSLEFIDQVAERAVGIGGEGLVCPQLQAGLIPAITELWCRDGREDPDALVAVSLDVERCIVDCIEEVRACISAQGSLSSGTDNLLQGVADKHEELIYLLQQRSQGSYSYDRG